MASSVREENEGSHKVGSHRRVYGSLRSHTLEELAEFWRYGASMIGRLNRLTLSPTSRFRRLPLQPLPLPGAAYFPSSRQSGSLGGVGRRRSG